MGEGMGKIEERRFNFSLLVGGLLRLKQPGDTEVSGIPQHLGEFHISNLGECHFFIPFFYNEISHLQSYNISWTNYVFNRIEARFYEHLGP